ncbi:MauE/DoxX family redox-associated membrane protein [Longispora fulva]|uniref:MauE/DoxX family redox-associated membrane protein n=1 Tax=Longispora fulva TaxID=619741 RepID=UPI003557BA58
MLGRIHENAGAVRRERAAPADHRRIRETALFALGWGIRGMLALVCAAAVTGKLRDRSARAEFGAMLAAVGVPGALRMPAAGALLGGEVAVAGLSLVPATARLGAVIAFALFGGLTLGVAHVVRSGSRTRCACFGRAKEVLGWRHVARNAALTAAAVAAVALPAAGPGRPADLVAATAVAAIGAIAVVLLDDVVSILRADRP